MNRLWIVVVVLFVLGMICMAIGTPEHHSEQMYQIEGVTIQ